MATYWEPPRSPLVDLLQPLSPDHPAYPDCSDIPIEDGQPVEGRYSEVQMRMLCEILYSSCTPGRKFEAMA
ncbi:MAG: hypothetical protein AAFP69_02755 [Planctomycetota bacterium]